MAKKVLCALLAVCLCCGLCACSKHTDEELRQALTNLVAKDAIETVKAADYYRVAIDTLEKDGKNQWKAEGNISYSDSNNLTHAVLYTTTLRYDTEKKTFSTETVFGKSFRIYG